MTAPVRRRRRDFQVKESVIQEACRQLYQHAGCEAIRAYLAAYDNDLHKAGSKGVNAAEQYDFLRRWLGAAYAVDFPAAARAPGGPNEG